MPPPNLKTRKRNNLNGGSKLSMSNFKLNAATFKKILANPEFVVDTLEELLFNPTYAYIIMGFLLPLELILNIGIVAKVNYTEIDWKAYMQEVEGFINGTFNYYELKGDTGPLVYPAGFVYIYSALYAITSQGANIKLAQYIFIGLYLLFLGSVFAIYKETKRVPPIAYFLMCLTSHRIHSIFVLRLFNDPIAMLFLYLSILCFIQRFWRVGCIAFSVAVSIKMNIILFAPGLFVILVLGTGLLNTFKYIFLCAIVQVILGAPFLLTFPFEYVHMSFDLGRQFFYKWTVNWKCVPEDIFLAKPFQMALLVMHVIFLLAFLNKTLTNIGGLKGLLTKRKPLKLSADSIIFLMFISNYIGVVFSRSLHYQFYVWYYHTLAYLLWSTQYPTYAKFLIYGVIELCWNIYPATAFSSAGLNTMHLILLRGLWNGLDKNAFFQIKTE